MKEREGCVQAGISELSGQTALVTGAARRIGRATALALGRAGVHVVLHYNHSKEEAQEAAEAIKALGVRCWTIQTDLADTQQAAALLGRSVEMAGPIDSLINNASIYPPSHLNDFSPEQLAECVNINAMAPMLLARAFVAQENGGQIINFLDSRLNNYDRTHVAYHLSKVVFANMSRLMALEFSPGVRVNAVAPGLILPPDGQDNSYLEKWAHTNLLNRWGSLECVTEAVLFLLRNEFVAGQIIYVDGGRNLRRTELKR
jgi:pteridine reductase